MSQLIKASIFEDHYDKYIFPYLANNYSPASMMIANSNGEAIRISRLMVEIAFPELQPALQTPDILGSQVNLKQ